MRAGIGFTAEPRLDAGEREEELIGRLDVLRGVRRILEREEKLCVDVRVCSPLGSR